MILYVAMQLLGVAPACESVAAAEHNCYIGAAAVCIYTGEAAARIALGARFTSEEVFDIIEYSVGGPESP